MTRKLIKKWTYYYGSIRQVTLTKNKDGLFDGGFICDDIHCGVSGCSEGKGSKNPPKEGFYDTPEEAEKFFDKQNRERISELKSINTWLREQIKKNIEEIAELKEED